MNSPEYRKRYIAQKALLINQQGHVLLVKSSSPNGEGHFWDFPGGQMEPGETALETLRREVQEETGVVIDPSKAELFYTKLTKGFGDMADDDIQKLFYAVPAPEGDLKLSWEHDQIKWIDPRQPLPEEVSGFAREVLEAYKKHARIFGADKRILGRKGYGLIQLIHGHGKGKTTAALGQSIRCAGSGRKVAIIYFDKGGSDHYFERELLNKIDGIDFWATGRDRIDPKTDRFDFSITEKDKQEAARGLELAQQALMSNKYDLVVFDEINSTADLGMLDVADVLDVLSKKQEYTEVILTGRNPDQRFIDAAHLVTEVRLEKHYFYSGVPAREGLDY